MSVKRIIPLTALAFMIGIAGYRSIENHQSIPKTFSDRVNRSEYSSRGVVDRIIQLKIENEKNIVAYVSLPFDYDDELHYKWILGENIILKTGELQGATAKGLKKDEKAKIEISVEGFVPTDLRHIGFEVWGLKNGRRLYAEGLISSQKEQSFEAIVQHVEKLRTKKSDGKR